MSSAMTSTNDSSLRSLVPVPPDSHFPIHNLPYSVFRRRSGDGRLFGHVGVAIGDGVLDLTLLEELGLLAPPALGGLRVFDTGTLNPFMALGKTAWSEVRLAISRLLRASEPTLRDNAS